MKKVKNLIENKGLINTFKRAKLKSYLNKSFLKKKDFFFIKYRKARFKKGFNSFSKLSLHKDIFINFFTLDKVTKVNMCLEKNSNYFKKLLMFIVYIFIKTCKPTTTTQRFKKTTFLLKFKKFLKFFKFFNKNNAGRNNTGTITVFSKGLKKKRSSISLSRPILWDRKLNIVISIFRNQKKLFTLNRHISGSISVHPYIDGVSVGQKIFSSNLPKNYWVNNFPGNTVLLKFLTKFTIFSNIHLCGIKKYALSNGSFCQLLDHFYDFNLVKVTLPSKKIKIVSGWNYTILGRNSHTDYHYNRLGKAGVNFLLGKKPKVRGVARNPVDHPHGGRTKTNQPEVSIWGWIAKRNK